MYSRGNPHRQAGMPQQLHRIGRLRPKQKRKTHGTNGVLSYSLVPLVDRAIGNLKQWLLGTHHGVGRHQLQAYLNEFANRRKQPMAACYLRAIQQSTLKMVQALWPARIPDFQASTLLGFYSRR